jgi:hypothetical protein
MIIDSKVNNENTKWSMEQIIGDIKHPKAQYKDSHNILGFVFFLSRFSPNVWLKSTIWPMGEMVTVTNMTPTREKVDDYWNANMITVIVDKWLDDTVKASI